MSRKIYMKDQYTTWAIIPHVMLKKALENCVWFTGKALLKGCNSNDCTKQDWKTQNNPKSFPRLLIISQNFHGTEAIVTANWELQYNRFGITLMSPETEKYYTHHWSSRGRRHIPRRPKTYGSNNIEGALERIRKALMDAEELCRKASIKEAEKEKKRQALQEELDELKETIGTDHLTRNGTSSSFIHGKDRNYCLYFHKMETDKGERYTIEHIGGYYTIEEIKKFLETITTNPQAVAERLTGERK